MYDIIIIGGGIAGLTAGIYAARAGMKTAIIEKEQLGGQALLADKIENYPAFSGKGFELIEKAEQQAVDSGVEIIYDEIISVDFSKEVKVLKGEENEYHAKAVILALGAAHKKAGFKGEEKYLGKGVSYCAVCDGAFFKGKKTTVIGGANTAVSDALYLADICEKVYIIYRRSKLRAEETLINRLNKHKNIEVIFGSVPIEVTGDKKVQKLITNNAEYDVDAVFIAVGLTPETELVKDKLSLDVDKSIISHNTQTDISGIFAAGDCRKKELRQLITAAADGAIAAEKAIKYIQDTKFF